MRVLHGRLFQASHILHSPLASSVADFTEPFAWRQLNQAQYYLVRNEGGMASEQYHVYRLGSNLTQNEPNSVRVEGANEATEHTVETTNSLDTELGTSTRLGNRSTSLTAVHASIALTWACLVGTW